jgi:WD40 repeat protein
LQKEFAMSLLRCKFWIGIFAFLTFGLGLVGTSPISWIISTEDVGRRQLDASPKKQNTRVDLYGDPLPPGAVARLGTLRFRVSGPVTCLAFSPNGKILASASSQLVHLWEVASGKVVAKFPQAANAVTFSPDGKILAAGGLNGVVVLWNVFTKTQIKTFQADSNVHTLVFSSSGKLVAAACRDEIHCWEIATGKSLEPRKENGIKCTSYFMQEHLGKKSEVELWQGVLGKETFHLLRIPSGRCPAALSNDGTKLAASNRVDFIYLWETTGRKSHLRLKARASALAFSPDGQILATGGDNILLWDTGTGNAVKKLPGHVLFNSSLAFSPDGKILASGGAGVICLWNVMTGKETLSHAGFEGGVFQVVFLRDGNNLATESSYKIHHWDLATQRSSCVFEEEAQEAQRIFVSPSGKLAAWARGREICLWDLVAKKEVWKHQSNPNDDCRFVFSPDSSKLAGAYGGKFVDLWNVENGKLLRRFETALASALTFSEGGKLFSWGGFCGKLQICEVLSGKVVVVLTIQPPQSQDPLKSSRINSVALSYDGARMAWASDHEGIKVCDTRTGKILLHFPIANVFAISPDGKVLAIGESKGLIRLFEVATKQEICQLHGHEGWINSLMFSPTGTRLASGSEDNTALVWSLLNLPEVSNEFPGPQPEYWAALDKKDPSVGFRALINLVASGERGVDFLKNRLKPQPLLDQKTLRSLIADLDAKDFSVRDQAMRTLAKLGFQAEAALRQTLEMKGSLEFKQRVQKLLTALEENPLPPGRLREIRAIQVLEMVGSKGAKQFLQTLARGDPFAPSTQDAMAALRRLGGLRQPGSGQRSLTTWWRLGVGGRIQRGGKIFGQLTSQLSYRTVEWLGKMGAHPAGLVTITSNVHCRGVSARGCA